ncbi:hypothetical protein Y032_0230g2988 [Ancylostoma ceylanicum]|nr:hypothetical protein Y032_0230g2988 [Ancylostoma ceylanicum]
MQSGPTALSYQWTDGTNVDFKNFLAGEPNFGSEEQYCTQILYDKEFGPNFGKWRAANCTDELYAFMCKRPKNRNLWKECNPNRYFSDVFKGNEYAVMHNGEKVTFLQARMQCEDLGAQLASIHSNEEVQLLKRVMQSNSTLMEDAWIGLVYTVGATSAYNRWIDNSAFDYKNFAPGEPNFSNEGEYCGQIMTEGDSFTKWKVTNCSENAYTFVCKRPRTGTGGGPGGSHGGSVTDSPSVVNPPTDTDPRFPHQFKGNKYAIIYDPGKVKFVQARTRCEDMGAELASIHSREEVEFLKSVIQSNSTLMEDAWIGMVYTISATSADKKWIDNSPFDYKNFAPGEPKSFGEGDYCGQIITNGDALSKWRVADCSEDAYTFVCKKSSSDNGSGGEGPGGSGGGGTGGGSGEDPNTKPSPDTDPRFPHEFKGDKYAIQYEPGKVKFVQARTQCENMGAELASIHSRQEAEFLKGVMQSNSTLMEDAWIGMVYTISATSANKKWIDNSPFDYKNFAPGEPKSFSEGDYCGQIMTEGDNLSKWKVVDCSEEAYTFVCKKSSNSNGNGGHGPGGSGGGGKGGGSGEDPNTKPYPGLDPAFPHQHKHNKYGVIYDPEKITFVQARVKCQNMNGELASIHSKSEVEFLKRVIQSNSTLMEDAWIGLIRTLGKTGGDHKWVDGSRFDYKNFAKGEPKYYTEGAYCGQMITNGDELSKWKMVDCAESAYTFVCKKRKNDGKGKDPGGSGGGPKDKPNNIDSPEEDPDTTRRPRPRPATPAPVEPPGVILPEDYTTTESYPDATQPPHCNPNTADPDDPSCKPISEYDPIVEEKGCYPV